MAAAAETYKLRANALEKDIKRAMVDFEGTYGAAPIAMHMSLNTLIKFELYLCRKCGCGLTHMTIGDLCRYCGVDISPWRMDDYVLNIYGR